MSILIVELHEGLREMMANHLATHGIPVRASASISQMDLEILEKKPAIVIMNAQAVKGTFLSGIMHLRQRFPLLGIVAMTDKDNEENHLRALQDGADHFLLKPVNLRILSATVMALLRRLHIRMESQEESVNVWRFNRRSQVLSGPSGMRVVFSERESAILTTLFLSPHVPVSTSRLLHSLNIPTEIFDPHRVDMIIYRIRKKLRQKEYQKQEATFEIRNIYGKGYLCVAPEGKASFYVVDGK